MKVKVYQVNPELDSHGTKFHSYDSAIESVGGIDPSIYKMVFDGELEADTLEDIYMILNQQQPPSYCGHALSVSDVIEVENNGEKEFFFCDSIGFEQLSEFNSQKAMELKGNRMLVLEPHKKPYEAIIEDSLEALQHAVGGYIEVTYPFDEDNAYVIGNDEAKLIGLKGNRRINGAVYAGNILIAADDGEGGTMDLTDEQVEKYSKMFEMPEDISDEEVKADMGWSFIGFN